MKKITLISDTKIVQKIFYLLSVKMRFQLNIISNFDENLNCDILIVDENFINDKFNFLKRHTKKLGAISSVELGFNKAKDFTISRPFLPTDLEATIKENFDSIDNGSKFVYQKQSIKFEPVIEFEQKATRVQNDILENLADEIAQDINDKNDESVVSIKIERKDGILDQNELAKIKKILESHEKTPEEDVSLAIDEALTEQENIYEISEIIDKTIDELKEKAAKQKNIKISLEQNELEELQPLLEKLNKDALQELANGAGLEIHLKINDQKNKLENK